MNIIGIPERGKEKNEQNLLEDIITDNFPNLGKETDIQVQETQSTKQKMKTNRFTPRHIIGNMSKIKDKERL